MPSFMLELLVFPFEKNENLCQCVRASDTIFIHEQETNQFPNGENKRLPLIKNHINSLLS